MYSSLSQRLSGIALRLTSLPRSVRPAGSGPRDRQNTPSSAKNDTMRSTTRLLNAAEIAFIRSRVTISRTLLVVASEAGLPQNVEGAIVVEPAAEHEEVVGEPVEVFHRL